MIELLWLRAKKQVSIQSLRRNHSGQSGTRVLAGLFANQEFFQPTQSLISTGSSRERFLTRLYKLAIVAIRITSQTLHRFLNQASQTTSFMAEILNMLQSTPNGK